MKDLYFARTYGQLYEGIEDGKCEVYDFTHSAGIIRHIFLKKKISFTEKGEVFFEIVTPFTFGGPSILSCKENRKKELIEAFQKAFKYYCDSNNIICEIVHFHPGLSNADDFIGLYNMHQIGDTLGTKLVDCKDPFNDEFSASCKKNIFVALKNGVDYRVTACPYNLHYFKDIYFSITDRKREVNNVWFNKEFFSSCFEIARKNTVIVEAVYKGRTIGISVSLLFNNILQPHLSAVLPEYEPLFPRHILHYGLTDWGKKNGIDIIHNGAGNAIGEEDDLYLFKKQFGTLKLKYFIGKKVWNEVVYEMLCKAVGVGTNADYFPAYRIGEQLLAEEEVSFIDT